MTNLVAAYGAPPLLQTSLRLAQVETAAIRQTARAEDLIAMYRMAISGQTAKLYKPERCPVTILDGVVTCHLQIDAFPLPQAEMDYTLVVAPGESGPGALVRVPREYDLVVPLADRVELGYLAEEFEIIAATAYHGLDGSVIRPPSIVLDGHLLRLSEPCFAVLRVRCLAVGYRHDIAISVAKEAGYRLDNFAATVQATWMIGDELQSESVELKIPECVLALLSFCPGSGDLVSRIGRPDGRQNGPVVRYNQCTGAMIEVRYE